MNANKLVKKPFPCSFYDITGIQNWLDEMALQGLFLDRVSYQSDRAFFKRGEPRPVRYRLDPVGRQWNDMERKALYAEAGWAFVDTIPRTFYIFSCDDPEAPELHSDPASLSYALKTLTRRHVRTDLILMLAFAALIAVLLLMTWSKFQINLILWEYPFMPLNFLILAFVIAALGFDCLLQFRRLQKARRALDSGLPLKAGKRHWRPNLPYWPTFLILMLLFNLADNYALQYTTVQTRGLDLSALSRPWPGLVHLEERPPTTDDSEDYSFMTLNHSPAAPVQEHFTDRWGVSYTQGYPCLKVWHYQTSSPTAARRLYQLERDKLDKTLKDNNAYLNSSDSITDLVPLAPVEHPGLDTLETASFHDKGLDGWAFTLRRGNDILLVRYSGQATLEEGLEQFLQALESEVAL